MRSIERGDFDLQSIGFIVLSSSDTAIAVIRPVGVVSAGNTQQASWEIAYLAHDHSLKQVCPNHWQALKDRFLGERRHMMLDKSAMYLDIG